MNTVFECIGSLPMGDDFREARILCDRECNGIYSLSVIGHDNVMMKFNLVSRKWSELHRSPSDVWFWSGNFFNLGRDPHDGHGKIFHQKYFFYDYEKYIFDVDTNEITILNTTGTEPRCAPTGNWSQKMAEYGNFIYAISGLMLDKQTGQTEIHRLDLQTRIWAIVVAINRAPERRELFEIAMDNDGKIFMFGGMLPDYSHPDMIQILYFDIKSALWRTLQTLPDSTNGYPKVNSDFGCVYYKNNAYIVGGFDTNRSDYCNEFWRLDLLSGQWTKFEAAFPGPLTSPNVAVDANGVVYVYNDCTYNPDGSRKSSTDIYRMPLVHQSLESLAWHAVLKAASPKFASLSDETLEELCQELGLTQMYMNKIKW